MACLMALSLELRRVGRLGFKLFNFYCGELLPRESF